MRYYVFLLLVAINGQMIAESVSYHSFCTNAAATFTMNLAQSPTFTNDVSVFIARTNGPERATARVVMAVALYDHYEQSADSVALELCINQCTNTLESLDCPCVSWQKSVASLVLSTALATRRQYHDSYFVCTNALAKYLATPASNDDIVLWNAISNHHLLPGLNVHDALNFYAAMSLVFTGSNLSMSAYTNSLPGFAVQKICEAIE